jgi:branched-chain amino acid transport system substrate-binding protein
MIRGFWCFALCLVAACDQLSPTLSVTASKDTGKGWIRVGIYGSLTGSESTFGISTEEGVRLAIEERNAACKDDWETNVDPACGVKGRKIDYFSLDDAGKSQEAGTAVTLLITKYQVHAVIGEVASSLSRAGGGVAQAYRVPMISPSSTNESVTLIGEMISRVCFIDGFQGYVVAKFARDNLHTKRVGILYDQQQAYSKGLALEFEKAYRALGGTITTKQTYTGGDADFSAQLNTLKATSPEAVFVPGYYNDAGNIAVQAKKLGINVPLLGGDGWDSPKLAEIGGAAMEGNYYANHYSAEETRPAIQKFVAKYQSRWGHVPDGLAALGYDAALVLFDAMERAPSLDGPDLAAAINATKNFPAVTGTITLDKNRNPVKSAVMLVMKDGKPRYAATVEPSNEPLPEVQIVEDTGGAGTSFLTKFLQTLVDTLAVGALYALIALGYTLVYGVLRFINFAHSDVFTFGAWISFTYATKLGWTEHSPGYALPVMLVLAMVTCGALGVTIERFAYRPLRKAPRLNVLITAIGVSLLLQNVGQLQQVFGPNPQHMPALIVDQSLVTISGVHIRLVDVIVVVLALALVGALQWLVYGTKMGRAMRAVSFDERVASLMGINVNRVIVFTFAVGSALAAAGGLLFALKYGGLQITAHSTWVLLGLTAFVAAVVGGIGDVRGAAIGALLIAGVQQFGAAYVSTQLRDIYVFSILIIVLLVRPSGLFGRSVVEKV